jgi:hypothetical protein
MLIGQVIVTTILSLLNLHMSGLLISLSLIDQLKRLLPYYLTSGGIGVIVYFTINIKHDLLAIIVSAFSYLFLYSLVSRILKLEGYNEFFLFLNSIKKKL